MLELLVKTNFLNNDILRATKSKKKDPKSRHISEKLGGRRRKDTLFK